MNDTSSRARLTVVSAMLFIAGAITGSLLKGPSDELTIQKLGNDDLHANGTTGRSRGDGPANAGEAVALTSEHTMEVSNSVSGRLGVQTSGEVSDPQGPSIIPFRKTDSPRRGQTRSRTEFERTKAFKFVAYHGIVFMPSTNGVSRADDGSFGSLADGLFFRVMAEDNSRVSGKALVVANQGSGDADFIRGECISFLEMCPGGWAQQLTITPEWDEENGGFTAVYSRFVYSDISKYFKKPPIIVHSVFHGVAIPWD